MPMIEQRAKGRSAPFEAVVAEGAPQKPQAAGSLGSPR